MTLYDRALFELNQLQQSFNSEISTLFRGLEEGGSVSALLIIGFAFLYGVIHALGPGHGKGIVASYFLQRGGALSAALRMGFSIAVIHTLSALSFTFGIYYLLTGMFRRNFMEITTLTTQISGGLLILLGLYMLYEFWHHHHHQKNQKTGWAAAFLAGIVPCPGVMTVLLFSLLMGHVMIGVLAAVAMSIGMGLTISIAGMMALSLQHQSDRFKGLRRALQLIAPLGVMIIGALLLL